MALVRVVNMAQTWLTSIPPLPMDLKQTEERISFLSDDGAIFLLDVLTRSRYILIFLNIGGVTSFEIGQRQCEKKKPKEAELLFTGGGGVGVAALRPYRLFYQD